MARDREEYHGGPRGRPSRAGGAGEPGALWRDVSRYAGDFRWGARGGEGYGRGFRRGYEVQGGFGLANERARFGGQDRYDRGMRRGGRRYPAEPGELRASRWHGRGYGRG